MKFEEFGFSEAILKAIQELGFTETTDVQAKSMGLVLEGKDVVIQSKTGSGKTAAFGLPIIDVLKDGQPGLRALILLPTRELAKQVHGDLESYGKYTNLKYALVYGGVGMEPQIKAIRHADILIGTPGRILDHLSQGTLKLDSIEVLILDEADRMLDMGFIDDVKNIISTMPGDHVTMLFSATMPSEIRQIAERMMFEPVTVKCESFVEDHLLRQFYVDAENRYKLSILKELIDRESPELSIVFCATRGLTDAVAKYLQSERIEAHALHGGHTQAKREQVLAGFHAGKVHVLVATDVAARGLDIDDVTHIFNYNIPKSEQDYIHRIGRTARAGKEGKVISLLGNDDHDDFRRIDAYFPGKIEKMGLENFTPRSVAMPRRSPDSFSGRGHFGGRSGPRRDGPREYGQSRGRSESRPGAGHSRAASHTSHASGGSRGGSRRERPSGERSHYGSKN